MITKIRYVVSERNKMIDVRLNSKIEPMAREVDMYSPRGLDQNVVRGY